MLNFNLFATTDIKNILDVLKAIHTNMGGCDNIGLASGFEGHNKWVYLKMEQFEKLVENCPFLGIMKL